ncbi:MAG TPA: metallophosphoesterase family protein [Bacillota bacterium]|nr:metallophosphoesterase family protein [Bacillota bacterium]
MKIAVISDTHIPHKHERLTGRVLAGLEGVDLILHCGDIVAPEVLEELSRYAPVEAVCGNHDEDYFGLELPRKKVVEVQGFRIGMIHGDELDGLHMNKMLQMEYLYRILCEPFIGEPGLDCIVFGHSHKPLLDFLRVEFQPPERVRKSLKKEVMLFNPGKATRTRNIASMGYLNIEEGCLRAEIKVFSYRREHKLYTGEET